MWILPISIHVVLFIINIKILFSSKKKWCTFNLKKKYFKKKIHNQNMSVLNMQFVFWNIINFDQTFDHWNFLIDKTLSCMWLMEIKSTLSLGLGLDSLHSHGWDLGRGQHFRPYNILWTSLWGLHGNDFFVLGLQSGNLETCKLQILQFCKLLIFSYEFWSRSFQLQNCTPWIILSKNILNVFIMSFDSYFPRAFTLLPFDYWHFFRL